MGTLFEELETQPKQKSQKKKLLEALENILDCVQSPIFPSYIARNLMKILHEIHGEVSAAFWVFYGFYTWVKCWNHISFSINAVK